MASLCIPDFTADSELGWPHCQTPKPVDTSQRQSLKAPRLWFAPVVEKHMESICDSTFPNECCIPLFLLYITLALSLFVWAQSVLHLQSQHKSSAGEWFFPLDPGGTAVGTCWWHSHNTALSWMSPGLREQTPDLELLLFSLVRSQNCFKPRQIYTVWCHLTAPASECKWHKEHVEQMEWDMHVKN